MTSVFIGGSRRITRLSDEIRERAKNIMAQGLTVLIGDASGADKAMQTLFANERYRNVVVYCAGRECRNNVGGWRVQHAETDRRVKSFQFYTMKDIAMSDEADYGFMLWDGKSVGTLQNVLNLSEREKPTLVYYAPEKSFVDIRSTVDIEKLMGRCHRRDIGVFEKRLNLSERLSCHQMILRT